MKKTFQKLNIQAINASILSAEEEPQWIPKKEGVQELLWNLKEDCEETVKLMLNFFHPSVETDAEINDETFAELFIKLELNFAMTELLRREFSISLLLH